MRKATAISAQYVPSESFTHQGNRKSIKKYLEKGYNVQQERNGFWVLAKPAKVLVNLQTDDGEVRCFNMKSDIVEFYRKNRISPKLYSRFLADVKAGRVNFYMDENGYMIK